MNAESRRMLAAVTADPGDALARLALADCLREAGEPEEIALESQVYPTRDAADAALSRACVGYGRHLAGLPGVAISRRR